MKTAEASLFMVPANGKTKREICFGMPYESQVIKALGSPTILHCYKKNKHVNPNKIFHNKQKRKKIT